jgi:hypothetical protein
LIYSPAIFFNKNLVKIAMIAPKKIPNIVKKLTDAPACPFNSFFTKVGAMPKHTVVPIPLDKASKESFIIKKILEKVEYLFLFCK